MAQESMPTRPDSTQQPPPEISDDHWTATPFSVQLLVRSLFEISDDDRVNTPDSVQKLLRSLIKEKLEQEVTPKIYNPIWSTPFMLFANATIIVVLAFLLGKKVAAQCIFPPEVSAISTAILLPVFFHIVWRNIYYAFIPSNYRQTIGDAIKIGAVNVPVTYLITFFNEIQPWKLSSRVLGFLLLILIAGGAFLNFSSYSLFYVEDEPSLQGFSIERLDTPPESLMIDQTLVIRAGEKVFVEAVLLGGVEASCTWSTATDNKMENKNCSTVFAVRPGIKQDVLTVTVQPACGTRQESISLPVVVQQ